MERERRIQWKSGLAVVAAALVLGSVPAHAATTLFTVAVQPVTVFAGSTGNSLDVTLTNTGTNAVTLVGFSFGLSVASTDITLSDATTATTLAPYIFSPDSLLGPDIAVTPPGQTLSASDLATSGDTIAAGATFGLGHVLFNVSALATGSYTVTLAAYPATSLADNTFADISPGLVTLTDGTITVQEASTVPEPCSLLLAAVALCAGGVRVRTGRRHR